jgi:hypothetical protein
LLLFVVCLFVCCVLFSGEDPWGWLGVGARQPAQQTHGW